MHGKSLESFTHILSRMIEKTTTAYVHVHLEVNDYVKSKEEKMFRFLDSKIALVMSTGRPVQVANLSSYDRKKAHGYIADKAIEGLSTHSE
jgi:predicted RNA-binding protein Jag